MICGWWCYILWRVVGVCIEDMDRRIIYRVVCDAWRFEFVRCINRICSNQWIVPKKQLMYSIIGPCVHHVSLFTASAAGIEARSPRTPSRLPVLVGSLQDPVRKRFADCCDLRRGFVWLEGTSRGRCIPWLVVGSWNHCRDQRCSRQGRCVEWQRHVFLL